MHFKEAKERPSTASFKGGSFKISKFIASVREVVVGRKLAASGAGNINGKLHLATELDQP